MHAGVEASSPDGNVQDWRSHPRLLRHAKSFQNHQDQGGVLLRYNRCAKSLPVEHLLRFSVHVAAWVALLPTELASKSMYTGGQEISAALVLARYLRLRGTAKLKLEAAQQTNLRSLLIRLLGLNGTEGLDLQDTNTLKLLKIALGHVRTILHDVEWASIKSSEQWRTLACAAGVELSNDTVNINIRITERDKCASSSSALPSVVSANAGIQSSKRSQLVGDKGGVETRTCSEGTKKLREMENTLQTTRYNNFPMSANKLRVWRCLATSAGTSS